MRPPQLEIPSQIPVMVLPDCNLLPHGLLPLFIFEPRYREMLADALETDRMLAIGTVDKDSPPVGEDEPAVFEYSCAGMIRACVSNEDGTSHLILQGVRRIRFTNWLETDKLYRLAEVEPVSHANENTAATKALAQRALESARELTDKGHQTPNAQALEEMESLEDPEPLADLIAYHLIRDPDRRQALLGMQEVGERLRYVIAELAKVGPSLP